MNKTALHFVYWLSAILTFTLTGCIAPDNPTVEGTGTPDVTQCGSIPGVGNGADFEPQKATVHDADGRSHPDLYYIAWAQLDARTDLRFPGKGYNDAGFEDKLLVSRLITSTDSNSKEKYQNWQVWPPQNKDCKDTEKVRIHSFDVAPNGKSLFVSMSREETDNLERRLGIYRLDIASQTVTKISTDNTVDFLYPTYVGNDTTSEHQMLLVAKTVGKKEIPFNYKAKAVMVDEYDRAPTPLIHKMDTQTGVVTRIGFNNSHQTEPMAMDGPQGTKLIVFNQWEHQDTVNRFALWKMQIDGSDNFTFFGQESSTDHSAKNLFSPRLVRSGPYQGYLLMGQGARSNHEFVSEGHILMVKRTNLDLRSEKLFLEKLDNTSGVDQHISRTPEHYNDQSFVYSYRAFSDNAYSLYLKDYPLTATSADSLPGTLIISDNNYHFVQPRSFYPTVSAPVAPGEGDIGQSRVSFTNNALNGKSGFLVQNLTLSQNGVQHQLTGLTVSDLRLQFFIPSHHFEDSNSVGLKNSQETSIPASGFIQPETDGSIGVVLKSGLYTWKLNKRFVYTDSANKTSDLWIPVRAERQEVDFVPNRVNACNQCHQERSQANIDKYASYTSIAAGKMKGTLSNVNDISTYNAGANVPDFHRQIVPLLQKPGPTGKSCIGCHNVKDKLNLSNTTGTASMNSTFRALLQGAHNLGGAAGVVPYLSSAINPMGMDDQYQPAPFLWSVLLNNDLSVPEDSTHPNGASRALDRAGDYGATYNAMVESDIAAINAVYDHSKHWSAEELQQFITYTTTQIPVGISDRMTFQTSSISTQSPAAQKAYQAMVRQCFNCHTSNLDNGIASVGFGLPSTKRFISEVWLRDTQSRFVMRSHLADKSDTAYSMLWWISNIMSSMEESLNSAARRINFADKDQSEILVYARGGKDLDGSGGFNANIASHPALAVSSSDYIALSNWVNGIQGSNQPPTMSSPASPLTFREYDPPAYLPEPVRWNDLDNELSQAFISNHEGNTHRFNDTMLALEYQDLVSAKLKTYAILGDRGEHAFNFTVSDGLYNDVIQTLPVTVTSDYNVPRPTSSLPNSYGFYTVRETGELRKLDTAGGDRSIGIIPNYNAATWTTVYRREDKGWLYFVEQKEQKIHVVDEANASYKFSITLNHALNKDSDSHKQTVYLIWWRPAEGTVSGELQGLLESKLSLTKNGDWYVGLGNGEPPDQPIVPEYRTRLVDGGDTVGVYVWRRATFMTKWNNDAADHNAIDRMSVLNLVTGKAKPLTAYEFTQQTIDAISYPAQKYFNVRAIVVAADGAFYGFNKDLNQADVTIFNFDPLTQIQKPVAVTPAWINNLISNPVKYATPFLVIGPR